VDTVKEMWAFIRWVWTSGAYEGRELADKECTAPITSPVLAEAFKTLDDRGFQVAAVVFNPRDYADVRMFCRDVLDIEVRVPLLREGLMALLWGASILTSQEQEVGEVMFLGGVPGEDWSHVLRKAIQVIKVDR
jgi:hypothetical protein